MATEFTDLSSAEKRQLHEEFKKAYPKQKNFEEREAKLKLIQKISMGCVIVSAVLAIIMYFLSKNFNENTLNLAYAVIIICAILFLISDAIDIACPFLIRKNKKKSLVALKIFQAWLKDRKGINYRVTFNAQDMKWKNYFDNINVAAEGYRG